MKSNDFDKLISKMSKCEKCLYLRRGDVDCSLINIYHNQDFCKNIPSMWTDWYNRLDANIMIIGQDWGIFKDMKKLNEAYINGDGDWNELINEEKSLTKKMLTRYIIESGYMCNFKIDDDFMNKIFITNAIMCARKGDNYRSNNIDLKKSTLNCLNYLKEQIDIVRPKVILTLGYYPLLSLSKIYKFALEKNLTETIKKMPIIEINDLVIIPVYHPSAQISKDKQIIQYKKIWEYLREV